MWADGVNLGVLSELLKYTLSPNDDDTLTMTKRMSALTELMTSTLTAFMNIAAVICDIIKAYRTKKVVVYNYGSTNDSDVKDVKIAVNNLGLHKVLLNTGHTAITERRAF